MTQASHLRPWVTRVRLRVSPYGRVLTVIFVLVLLLLGLNALLSWGLLGLSAKKSQGVAIGVGLLWWLFVSPHWGDIDDKVSIRRRKDV